MVAAPLMVRIGTLLPWAVILYSVIELAAPSATMMLFQESAARCDAKARSGFVERFCDCPSVVAPGKAADPFGDPAPEHPLIRTTAPAQRMARGALQAKAHGFTLPIRKAPPKATLLHCTPFFPKRRTARSGGPRSAVSRASADRRGPGATNRPIALAFHDSGKPLRRERRRLSLEGRERHRLRPGGLSPTQTISQGITVPSAIAFDGHENPYVANARINSVTVYTPKTHELLRTIGEGVYYPVHSIRAIVIWVVAPTFNTARHRSGAECGALDRVRNPGDLAIGQ